MRVMGGGVLLDKKQDFGLTQSTALFVECPLRVISRHFSASSSTSHPMTEKLTLRAG
jgi:hypothetical protein